mmetsp:Transcript_5540/g.14380  ORF Transcript_5540/g.14380 Transcript_5540/m.14380 type:complete len:311 (+) Transcript_5540:345-1277(+)
MPKIADWGGLMMGVLSKLPKTPPFVIENVPPAMSSMLMVPSLAFWPKSAMFFSTPANVSWSASLNTGTTSPFGEATATDMSTKSLYMMSLPSITPFTAGTCFKASAAALTNTDMKPSFTPCFSWKISLYCFLNCIMLVMSISLKVVSMAKVFWAPFRRSAMRFLIRVIATRLSLGWPASALGVAGAAGAGAAGVGAAGAFFFGAGFSAGFSAAGLGLGAASSVFFAGFSFLGSSAFGATSPRVIEATVCPTSTVSSIDTRISPITPAPGDRMSIVTLSVSIWRMTSSSATASPGFFSIAAMVPSDMESPI